jgi:acetyl-CoA C-acetyltransferase
MNAERRTAAVIVGYARTPFARFTGAFSRIPAAVLGAHAAAAALERAGVRPDAVDAVVVGQVLQAGAGQNPARQTAVGAGVPLTVPAITLNAVCLSGAEAIAQGARLIATGEARIVLAVGQESMSLAPHVIPSSRSGTKYGAIGVIDTVEHDGLTDAFERRSMGLSTEERNPGFGITREQQDAFAATSHQRAAASVEFHAGEIAPLAARDGAEPLAHDDGVRPETTPETLSRLRPAFTPDGTITAGNASQITDGAAAVVLMAEDAAAELGVAPIARILATAFVAGPDVSLHDQPAAAIEAALANAGRTSAELSAVEINEAFAAVGLRSTQRLGIDPAIVNRHGGAIALGHPIGASGARIVGSLARQLAAAGPGSIGAAALCGGGGQGSALLLEAI